MFDLPCILFAGGKSSRMGEDKALLPFGGFSSLAQFQYERLLPLFSNVYISAKTAEKFPFDAPILLDPENAEFAPTAGFVSAFEQLDSDRIMVLSVDTPFVGKKEFARLLAADESDLDAVIARTNEGSHPMCGIYHRTLVPELMRMLRENDHRLGKLLGASHTRFVAFEDDAPFMNLNHPHEYTLALSRFCEPDK